MFDQEAQISDPVLRDYDLLRDDAGLVDLPGISLLEMTGDDRKGWLQGQATNDLRKLENGASNVFCLAAITGHLVSVCEAWALSDRLLLTVPEVTRDDVLARVEQMVVMEDVAARDVSQVFRLMSIQGPSATARLSKLMALPSLDAGASSVGDAEAFALRSNRTGLGGWDIWLRASERKAIKALQAEFRPIGREAYVIARLEAGIPVFGVDMGVKTFPSEMGKAFEDRHVSYSKGCYMGQEVLMRIHARGHTNRTWVGLLADEPLEPGAAISHLNRREAGVVTSAAFSPDYGFVGAAMLRNEAAFDGEIVQVAAGARMITTEVRHMPILR